MAQTFNNGESLASIRAKLNANAGEIDLKASLTGIETLTNKTISSGVFTGNSAFDTDTLFVDATNNRVGMGTTTPYDKLHISTTGTGITNGLRLQNTDGGTIGAGVGLVYTTFGSNIPTGRIDNVRTGTGIYALVFSDYSSTGLAEAMRIRNNNVGIGTTTPSERLDVNGRARIVNTDDQLTLEGSTRGRIFLRQTGNTYYGLEQTSNRLNFQEWNSSGSFVRNSMTIDTGGNVGINKLVPLSRFSVVGLPTSSVGLTSGDVWRNGTVLNIIT